MGKDKEAKEEERVKEEKWKRNMCQKIKMVTREKERHEKGKMEKMGQMEKYRR